MVVQQSPLFAEAATLAQTLRQSAATREQYAELLQAVVASQPGHDGARMALAMVMWEDGAQRDAIAEMRLLLARRPEDARLRATLAMALVQTGAAADGVSLFETLEGGPVGQEMRTVHAVGLWLSGRQDEAIADLRSVVRDAPEAARLRYLLSFMLLATGAWTEGWPEFAWRWRIPEMQYAWRRPATPLEQPDPAAWRGRTVLLFAEQGHGDTLMCLRYVPLVEAAGARVTLQVQPGLVRLARWMAPRAEVVPSGAATPAHDFEVPMLHLPWAFGTMPATVPGTVPYLAADADEVAAWQRRMAGLPGLRVGLVWAGESYRHLPAAHAGDLVRSTTLAALAPLATVPGVSFVSLQVGPRAEEAAHPPEGMLLHDWTANLRDFADTAALMKALDLIVTVDTGVVHLAGALGRPVWLLNRHNGCWRWLRNRQDSVWYPTLRQFHQATPNDWAGVARSVAAALAEIAAAADRTAPQHG